MRFRLISLALVAALLAAGVPLSGRSAAVLARGTATLPQGIARGLGLRPSFTDGRSPHLLRVGLAGPTTAAVAPASVDLTPYDPPVGYQGAANSCAAWATA